MQSHAWGAKVVDASQVFKPVGPGPFPVALILHGCGGKTPFLEAYAQTAVDAGYAAIVVDSLKPRGMSTLDAKLLVCTGVRLHGLKRAADLFAVLAWLERQPWADASRVFLAGWSHGGWTIMDGYAIGANAARATGLADADPARLRAQVKGALLVYPFAGYPALTTRHGWGGAGPKVWSVLAGRDRVVGWKAPSRALERLKRDGISVDSVFHADATHAFDDDRANDPRSRYRPDLFGQTRDYFTRALTETSKI
ncbi:MAG: dienelactone hydrolase [Caulobacter sp. 12-67-6]|nr:MAG: dienelactone hydrolase [Caulobacter sp. 12-67-6]OYX93901.1 MAG: dienelactone hydrolase [Caulobacter sp. 35-67-4]